MRLLAAGALRNDFWSFLQLDRRERHLMKYPNDFDNLTGAVTGRTTVDSVSGGNGRAYAFSPDGNLIYASYYGYEFYQYDKD